VGPFKTLRTVKVSSNGYFDLKMKFPTSGTLQLQYTYPNDPLLPVGVAGSTITSRNFVIKAH
jgi:hypothetical protein